MGKRIKVVFDTNVWVSIFMKKRLGERFSKIIEEGRVKIYISKQILMEISKVLVYPKVNELLKLSGVSAKEILQTVIKNSISVRPKHQVKIIKEDPEDNKILECALQAKCDFIVSGDKHLLKLGKFNGAKIITPRKFLETLGV